MKMDERESMDRAISLDETIRVLMEDAERMQKNLDVLTASGVINTALQNAIGNTRKVIKNLIADLKRELEGR